MTRPQQQLSSSAAVGRVSRTTECDTSDGSESLYLPHGTGNEEYFRIRHRVCDFDGISTGTHHQQSYTSYIDPLLLHPSSVQTISTNRNQPDRRPPGTVFVTSRTPKLSRATVTPKWSLSFVCVVFALLLSITEVRGGCQAGSYPKFDVISGGQVCTLCPAGSYSYANVNKCTPCAAGTASTKVGAKSPCPCCTIATYSLAGATICATCAPGSSSQTCSSSCTVGKAYTYSPTNLPTSQPSRRPTSLPTNPTGQPTHQPTSQPSREPTRQPTSKPTRQPTSQVSHFFKPSFSP
jgi:hypothetical protein